MAAGRLGRPIDRRQGVRVLACFAVDRGLSTSIVDCRRIGAHGRNIRPCRTNRCCGDECYAAFPSVLRRRRTLTHANPTPTPMTTIVQNTTEPPFELV